MIITRQQLECSTNQFESPACGIESLVCATPIMAVIATASRSLVSAGSIPNASVAISTMMNSGRADVNLVHVLPPHLAVLLVRKLIGRDPQAVVGRAAFDPRVEDVVSVLRLRHRRGERRVIVQVARGAPRWAVLASLSVPASFLVARSLRSYVPSRSRIFRSFRSFPCPLQRD